MDTGKQQFPNQSNPEKINVRIPPEVDRVLIERGVDLVRELSRQGHAVTIGEHDPVLSSPNATGTKAVETIVLAAAGASYLVSLGIVKILNAVLGRPVHGRLGAVRPVLDDYGNQVRDASGNPLTYREGDRLVVESKTAQDKGEVFRANALNILTIELDTRSDTPGQNSPTNQS